MAAGYKYNERDIMRVVKELVKVDQLAEPPKFKSRSFNLLTRIFFEELWVPDSDVMLYKDLNIRLRYPQKILELAKQILYFDAEKLSTQVDWEMPSIEYLQPLAQAILDAFILQIIEDGWMPQKAVRLAGKLCRGSDIEIVDTNEDFTLSISTIDAESCRRSAVFIDTRTIRSKADLVLDTGKEFGIKLSPGQALEAAVCSLAAHEWAHSIGPAYARKLLAFRKKLPWKWDKWYNNMYVDRLIELNAQKIIWREAEKVSLPVVEIEEDWEGRVGLSIHDERFVASFEDEAVRFALVRAGVSSTEAGLVFDEIKARRKVSLENILLLRKYLGLNDHQAEILVEDIRQVLEDADLDPERFITPKILQSKNLGYFSSYDRQQLSHMLNLAQLKLNQQGLKEAVLCSILQVKRELHEANREVDN